MARTKKKQPDLSRARRKRKKTTSGLTPVSFLREMGIRRRSPEQVFTADYYREVRKAGGDPSLLERVGVFAPEVGEVNFRTEDLAKRFHSAEYKRLLGHLRSFEELEGYPANPRQIADLGGGTGIVSLYLATSFPSCKVTVYDHAPRQLKLGRKWARERRVSNIHFVHASYQQLAAQPAAEDKDLVIFFFGLAPTEPGTAPTEEQQAAMTVLSRQLSPTGVGVISSAHCLLSVFEAIRHAGLGVDWPLTIARGTARDGAYFIEENYIFVRRGMPHLARDSTEDQNAHMSAVLFPKGPVACGPNLPARDKRFFQSAEGLLLLEGGSHFRRVRLLHQSGILLLEVTAKRAGEKRHYVGTLADVNYFLLAIAEPLAKWQSPDQLGFKRYRIHPRLKGFIDYTCIVRNG